MTEQPNVIERVNGTEPATTVEKITEAELVTTHDEDKPTFDFGELSYDDVIQLQRTHVRVQKMLADGGDENEAQQMTNEIFDSLGMIITYMPRHWLVKRAPANLDITQQGMLRKYIRADRMMAVMNAFREEQEKKA